MTTAPKRISKTKTLPEWKAALIACGIVSVPAIGGWAFITNSHKHACAIRASNSAPPNPKEGAEPEITKAAVEPTPHQGTVHQNERLPDARVPYVPEKARLARPESPDGVVSEKKQQKFEWPKEAAEDIGTLSERFAEQHAYAYGGGEKGKNRVKEILQQAIDAWLSTTAPDMPLEEARSRYLKSAYRAAIYGANLQIAYDLAHAENKRGAEKAGLYIP